MAIQDFERWFLKKQFGAKTRFAMYKKLVRFLSSGVALTSALDIMFDHVTDGGNKRKMKTPQAIALDEWRRNIRNGHSFSRAITGWAPDRERVVIEAGENAGRLDVAIQNAIFIHQGSAQIKAAILKGLAYPFLLILMAIGFMALFGFRVIPAFEEIIPRENWTGIGAQMAVMSDFVRNGLLQSIGGFGIFVSLLLFSLPRWTGRIRARLDGIPPWSLYRLSMGSSFLLGISAMHKAGIPLTRSLLIMQRDAPPWYRERIDLTLRHVRNGLNLGEALHKTGYNFPTKETVLDLRAYAELDGFDEVLEEMGRTWMEDSIAAIQAQSAILRNVALIVMGGVFMWLASGIFSLQQLVQSAA